MTELNVKPPEYFGIFYIPEARMYEFHKKFELFNKPMLSSASPPVNTTNGTFPLVDQLCAFAHNTNMFMYDMNNAVKHCTFGTSIVYNEKFISTLDYAFFSLFPKIPLFSSSEKAFEFLLDVSRLLDGTSYVEFRYGSVKKILPEELMVVSWPIDKVLSVSKTEALLINPYVPAFF